MNKYTVTEMDKGVAVNSILLKDKSVHWTKVSREYREKNNMRSNVVLNPINVIVQSDLSAVKLRTVNSYNEFARKKGYRKF